MTNDECPAAVLRFIGRASDGTMSESSLSQIHACPSCSATGAALEAARAAGDQTDWLASGRPAAVGGGRVPRIASSRVPAAR